MKLIAKLGWIATYLILSAIICFVLIPLRLFVVFIDLVYDTLKWFVEDFWWHE